MSHTFWEEKGIYWPDCENRKDFDHAMSRIDAIDAALELCRGHDVCLQAGGWIGMWPTQLASNFKHVITYEPVPYLFACLAANVRRLCVDKVVVARTAALGAREGSLELTVALSGCTSAVPEDSAKYQSRVIEKRTVPMATVDGECAALKAVDAIFLDVERFEIPVLEGARETIKKFSPVITVEVLKGEGPNIETYMKSIGYRLRDRAHNDWIYTR